MTNYYREAANGFIPLFLSVVCVAGSFAMGGWKIGVAATIILIGAVALMFAIGSTINWLDKKANEYDDR